MDKVLKGEIKFSWSDSKSSLDNIIECPKEIRIMIEFDNDNINNLESVMNDILKIAYKKRSLDSWSNINGWFSGEGKNMILTTNGVKINDNNEKYGSIFIYCTHETDIYETFFSCNIMKEKQVTYIG